MTKEIAAKETKNDEIGVLFPHNPDSSRLLVGCRRADYSASRIARAVEDCDAQLINLNVTSLGRDSADEDGYSDPVTATLLVDLRVSHRSPAAVARSLERYGYEVVSAEGPDGCDDDDFARTRIDEFFHYLSI